MRIEIRRDGEGKPWKVGLHFEGGRTAVVGLRWQFSEALTVLDEYRGDEAVRYEVYDGGERVAQGYRA